MVKSLGWLGKAFSRVKTPHEGQILLEKLEAELAKAVDDYSGHSYSGHPEEQLELIEQRKFWVDRCLAAKVRGWTVSPESLEDAETNIRLWEETLPDYRGSSADRDRLTKFFIARLEWAEKGLV